jgi:hypothetical protein
MNDPDAEVFILVLVQIMNKIEKQDCKYAENLSFKIIEGTDRPELRLKSYVILFFK